MDIRGAALFFSAAGDGLLGGDLVAVSFSAADDVLGGGLVGFPLP